MRALPIVALGAALVVSAWGPGRAEGTRPTLRVVDRVPLTVVGTGFAAKEDVRLTLRAGVARPASRSARADGDGRFRAAFRALLAVEPCRGALVITAAGSQGSRASWKRACRPPSTSPPRAAG
jgi:hypothetical protein